MAKKTPTSAAMVTDYIEMVYSSEVDGNETLPCAARVVEVEMRTMMRTMGQQ